MGIDLFGQDVTINKIGADDLHDAHMDLQIARNKARQTLQNLEQQKQNAFEKATLEKNRDLRRSYLNEIVTAGFRMGLSRVALDAVEGQLRKVSVVEAIKDFQNQRIKSPLLDKLNKLRISSIDKAMEEILDAAGRLFARHG